jgi:hypothetical protein
MAKGTDHIVGGITCWFIAAYCLRTYITSFCILSLVLLCSIAGSLFPDIDIKSKGQKLFYGLMAPAYIFLFTQKQYMLCFAVGLCALMPVLVNHRGLFHRWWFIVSFAGLWGYACISMFPRYTYTVSLATLFFILGSLSHLYLDFGLFKMFFK